MHVATWTLTILFFRHLARVRKWMVWPAATLAIALAIAALPDNFFYWEAQYKDLPHVPSLVWSDDWQATLDTLKAMPGERHVIAADWGMGRHVCALTHHRSAFGTEYTTPYYSDRMDELHAFETRPDESETPLIRWADTVLVPGGDYGWRTAMRRSRKWREVACSRAWCVYARR